MCREHLYAQQVILVSIILRAHLARRKLLPVDVIEGALSMATLLPPEIIAQALSGNVLESGTATAIICMLRLELLWSRLPPRARRELNVLPAVLACG